MHVKRSKIVFKPFLYSPSINYHVARIKAQKKPRTRVQGIKKSPCGIGAYVCVFGKPYRFTRLSSVELSRHTMYVIVACTTFLIPRSFGNFLYVSALRLGVYGWLSSVPKNVITFSRLSC